MAKAERELSLYEEIDVGGTSDWDMDVCDAPGFLGPYIRRWIGHGHQQMAEKRLHNLPRN
jgi:hypothetical protein